MTFHIMSYATEMERARHNKRSADMFGVKPTFVQMHGQYIELMMERINKFIQFLETLPGDDVVLFTDCYDVIYNQPSEVMLERFYSKGCDILLSGEINCFPDACIPMWNGIRTDKVRLYPNGGVFMGRAKGLLYMFYGWKPWNEVTDIMSRIYDQGYYHVFYLNNPNRSVVQIDEDCSVFQSMHWVSWNDVNIQNGQVVNTVLNKTPCLLHFNGGVWKKEDGSDIQPVILDRMEYSKANLTTETLKDQQQNTFHARAARSQV